MSKVTRKCSNKKCGAMFTARSADVKRGWARFCSKSCKAYVQEKRTGQYSDLLKASSSSSRYADTEFDPCDTIHPFSEEAFSGF